MDWAYIFATAVLAAAALSSNAAARRLSLRPPGGWGACPGPGEHAHFGIEHVGVESV
jgi:hypothetical protein